MTYTQQDCIDGLQAAAETLGPEFTRSEYADTDLSPSQMTIRRRFGGSWNAAKAAAELPTKGGRREVNSDYFAEIDTAEKAYWLGAMYGDGSVMEERPCASLVVHARDEEWVRSFCHDVASTYAVGIYEDYETPSAGVQIYDEEFVENLISQGCDHDKTHSASLPELDGGLRAPFIRGLSDADGHIRYGRPSRWVLTGQLPRLRRLQSWLPVESSIDEAAYGHQMIVTKHDDLLPLLRWMYPENARPAMRRKQETANNAKTYLTELR